MLAHSVVFRGAKTPNVVGFFDGTGLEVKKPITSARVAETGRKAVLDSRLDFAWKPDFAWNLRDQH
jgi:hypothetical protein